ncbi:MAG: quinoprotein dehydrogenase-associated SoxYZ-like carrier [Gammaproteobacteria bacterium]
MPRCTISTAIAFIVAAAFACVAPAAEQDFREVESERAWREDIQPGAFGDRALNEDAEQRIVQIKAPYRAEDGSIVPISIHTDAAAAGSAIRRIHVFVDKNPLPAVGVFDFLSPEGRADIALRIRVDDFSFVRAIAETGDGRLYMAKSFVRSLGGCSAPPPNSIEESLAQMGLIRFKPVGEWTPGRPSLAQFQIRHPNITGLQPMRIGSRVLPPPYFIREVRVTYDGQPILAAQLTFAVSQDPSFRFFFVPNASGRLRIEAVDTKDRKYEFEEAIAAPAAAS